MKVGKFLGIQPNVNDELSKGSNSRQFLSQTGSVLIKNYIKLPRLFYLKSKIKNDRTLDGSYVLNLNQPKPMMTPFYGFKPFYACGTLLWLRIKNVCYGLTWFRTCGLW